ncbi:MAG: hypothetical protein LBQ31_06120 [Bacteroidales bacterium]|jgi:hypothetical protein|nr:hypothetical protein [Bacteroidales bacterium]
MKEIFFIVTLIFAFSSYRQKVRSSDTTSLSSKQSVVLADVYGKHKRADTASSKPISKDVVAINALKNYYPGADTVSSKIKVIYKDETKKYGRNNDPAYIVNGALINSEHFPKLASIKPENIKEIKVASVDTQIGNSKYHGIIFITTKDDYKPKPVSLNDLKLKYTNIRGKSTVFQIDGNIVNGDCHEYFIDENYILQIIVDKFENKNEGLSFDIINILTKSEENIKKSKEVRIRG